MKTYITIVICGISRLQSLVGVAHDSTHAHKQLDSAIVLSRVSAERRAELSGGDVDLACADVIVQQTWDTEYSDKEFLKQIRYNIHGSMLSAQANDVECVHLPGPFEDTTGVLAEMQRKNK